MPAILHFLSPRGAGRILLVMACMALPACTKEQKAPASPDAPLAERLALADPAQGALIFHQCAACHNLSDGGADRDGPNLWDVLGKPVATNSDRFAYTAALKVAGGVWSCDRMDRWLSDPPRLVPGTSMGFPGLPNGADRADVIAYLAQHGRSPAEAVCRSG